MMMMAWRRAACVAVAALSAAAATGLSLRHIYKHLRNYTEPVYQRFIVRILFMIPVYASMSFLSLLLPHKSIYFNSTREIYDAWVIYNFLSLCLEWVGGAGAVVLSLNGRVLKPSWLLMTCCIPAIPLDGRFISVCQSQTPRLRLQCGLPFCFCIFASVLLEWRIGDEINVYQFAQTLVKLVFTDTVPK